MPAPLLPAIFYSIALTVFFLKYNSIEKIQLIVVPAIVYLAWSVAYGLSYHHFGPPPGDLRGPTLPLTVGALALWGAISGSVGAFFLVTGLCLIVRQLRSIETVLINCLAGGLAGVLLVTYVWLTGDIKVTS
jgi:uncharacterized membrane protein YozB (DUF420 family)